MITSTRLGSDEVCLLSLKPQMQLPDWSDLNKCGRNNIKQSLATSIGCNDL